MNISDKHLSTVLGSYAANPFLYKVHQRQMSVPMDSVIIRGRYRLNEAFQGGIMVVTNLFVVRNISMVSNLYKRNGVTLQSMD
jgi:hypothetical protein